MWDWMKFGRGTVQTPLTRTEVVNMASRFKNRMTWQCPCGSTMTIRSTTPREDGASQLTFHPLGHPLAGHATRAAGELSWSELALERGWTSDPVQCPPCRAGISRGDYKTLRREIERLKSFPGNENEIARLTKKITPR